MVAPISLKHKLKNGNSMRSIAQPTTWTDAVCNRYFKKMKISKHYIRNARREVDRHEVKSLPKIILFNYEIDKDHGKPTSNKIKAE